MAEKTLSIKLSLNDKQFQSALRKTTRRLNKFGQSMKKTGQTMSTSLTLPILGIGAASVKLASDFEETQSKFNTVFRDISAQANNTARNLEKDFGLSSRAAMQLLGDTGDLLTGFGFTQEEALDLSNEVNKLAVDLASFTNFAGGAEGASLALTKALLGERESIKQLGIAITEADLKKFAEEQGLVFKELDRVAKATLTFELAARQSANAIGDYARTSGSFANQTRKLRADLENLGVEIGQKLLPIAVKILNKIKDVIEVFASMSSETKEMILGFTLLTGAIGPFLIVIGSLLTTLIALGPQFFLVSSAILALAAGIAYVVDNFEAFKERFSLDFIWNSIVMGVQTTLRAFGSLIDGYNKLIDKLGKGKLDFLKSSNEFDKLADNIDSLKVETKDYEHEFNSFGDSISNTIDKIVPKFGELFRAMGGGTGGAVKGLPTVKAKTPKQGMMAGAMTKVQMPELENEALSLMDIFMQLESTIEKMGESLGRVLMAGAENFEDFAKQVKSAARSAIGALLAEGVAAAVSSALKNPAIALNPLLIPVIAGAAGGLAKTAFNSLIPAFAEGGLVSGATIGMVGEGPGTSMSNPEVIAPLNKLKSMIGGGDGVQVFGTISGADILLSSDRARNNRNRTRGY